MFFDLPVKTKLEKKNAAQFRKFLIRDGYNMLQYSVYGRLCNGEDGVQKHLSRLQEVLPSEGHIRAMQVTDQQYSRIQILVGKNRYKGKKSDARQLVLL